MSKPIRVFSALFLIGGIENTKGAKYLIAMLKPIPGDVMFSVCCLVKFRIFSPIGWRNFVYISVCFFSIK